MLTGAKLEDRREQRKVLQSLYADYDAKRHDVFVIRFNKEQDTAALARFMERRGIIPGKDGKCSNTP